MHYVKYTLTNDTGPLDKCQKMVFSAILKEVIFT